MEIAILGLPSSGKSSLFKALTGVSVSVTSPGREAPLVGVAKLEDKRLYDIASIFKPRRIVPAEFTFRDLPPAREARAQKAIGGQHLNLLQKADALLLTIRAFESVSVPHVLNSVDSNRDVRAMIGELALSDLVIAEKRAERIRDQMKGARVAERDALLKEQAVIERIKGNLGNEVPIREQGLLEADMRLVANYQFLTAKPLLLVFNIGEELLARAPALEKEWATKYERPGVVVGAVSAKLEAELVEMDEMDRTEFRQSMGASELDMNHVLRKLRELLRMVTFFTGAGEEVRAWLVASNTPAAKAAGTIHSDMERGFIRAEVITYDDLMRCGSIAEGRRQGVLRLEGKDYPVQDGDFITILFNV
jgi:GTP-binding protein YchF